MGLTVSAPAQRTDTIVLFKAARRWESEYQSSIRRHAPLSFASYHGRDCDETIGRFCVYHDTGRDALPAEPPGINGARDRAIDGLERAVLVAPGQTVFVFSLVRLLIADHRSDRAVAVARAYARAGGRDGYMLLGLALHASGQTEAATSELKAWITTLPPTERERIAEIGWLIDPAEGRRYGKLSVSDRRQYEARVWRYADPLYLTPGNEAWTEHVYRQIATRILEKRRTLSTHSWGTDLAELIVRFGEPVITTRSWSSGSMGPAETYSEHWDPSQRAYVPPLLDSALLLTARLDTLWPVDSIPRRSGHAPPTIRQMNALQHQIAIFPGQLPHIKASASFPADSLTHPSAIVAGLFLLDSALQIIEQRPALTRPEGDSVAITMDMPILPEARYYSLEAYDTISKFAVRSRYVLVWPTRAGGLEISGLLVSNPRPVIETGQRFGIYAEVSAVEGSRRLVKVGLETYRLGRTSALYRLAGWIGGKAGFGGGRFATRLAWTLEIAPGAPTPVDITLDLGEPPPGKYLIGLTVTDSTTGSSVRTSRAVLIIRSATRPTQR